VPDVPQFIRIEVERDGKEDEHVKKFLMSESGIYPERTQRPDVFLFFTCYF